MIELDTLTPPALPRANVPCAILRSSSLGINHRDQDRQFTPRAHGYQSYVGAPYTNAPMCAMDSDGLSHKFAVGPSYCFLFANDTVVEQPLRIENFTRTITDHATDFIGAQTPTTPWFFFMSYFHVHTPLFTSRANRGRSKGGAFGDNLEELDDSVGALIGAVRTRGFSNSTLIFFTADNGPYQEEGWERCGRANLYDPATGALRGRLRGGKGQEFEGGVRMAAAVLWPGVTPVGSVTNELVSTMDIFPTVLAAAGIRLPAGYTIDGHDMAPLLRAPASATTQWSVFLHYCGFRIIGARVGSRWKVFWATQKWYTNDRHDSSICNECCNGVNTAGVVVTGTNATQLCGCADRDLDSHEDVPVVFDLDHDPFEANPLTKATWPAGAGVSYSALVSQAHVARTAMEAELHPKPSLGGAGTCTAGIPSASRQPCCAGCKASGLIHLKCHKDAEDGTGNASVLELMAEVSMDGDEEGILETESVGSGREECTCG